MQVKLEDVSSVKKIFHVELSDKEVTHEFDNAYKQISQTQKVKGFRKGKTPVAVLEKTFGEDVVSSLTAQIISDNLQKAFEGHNFAILGEPIIKQGELKRGKPFNFDIIIEVAPKIGNLNINGLNFTKKRYVIRDEEIDAHLKILQHNVAKTEPILLIRPVQHGDFVLVDLKGYYQGKIVDQSDNMLAKVGDLNLPKEIDACLPGMSIGDVKQVTIKLPDEIENKELAGREIDFRLELKEIRKEILPEINDDMAKALGKYETLEDLKNSIRKNLESVYEVHAKRELNEKIYQALLQQQSFELPEILIKMELESIKKEIEESLAEKNITLEKAGYTDETIRQKYHKVAENIIQRELILNHVVNQEKITISQDELEATYKMLAEVKKYPIEKIKQHYNENPESLKAFQYTLQEQKALQMIIDASNITIVDCNTEDLEQELNSLREMVL
jgi:trigger factor